MYTFLAILIQYLPKVVLVSSQRSACDVAVRSCPIPIIVELEGVPVIVEISGKGIAIVSCKVKHFRAAIFDSITRNDVDR